MISMSCANGVPAVVALDAMMRSASSAHSAVLSEPDGYSLELTNLLLYAHSYMHVRMLSVKAVLTHAKAASQIQFF